MKTLSILALGFLISTPTFAASCFDQGLTILRKSYPQAITVWNQLSFKDSKAFIQCYQNGEVYMPTLITFIHENIHIYDQQLGQNTGTLDHIFYLINQNQLRVAHHPGYTAPSHQRGKVLSVFSAKEQLDSYTQKYMVQRGDQVFPTLLDELNAYAHGLDAASRLPLKPSEPATSLTDGLLATMTFTLRYYQYFHTEDPQYYQTVLMSADLRAIVTGLMDQARSVLEATANRRALRLSPQMWGAALKERALQSEWQAITGRETSIIPDFSYLNLPMLEVSMKKTNKGTRIEYTWKNRQTIIEFTSTGQVVQFSIDGVTPSSIQIGGVPTNHGMMIYDASDAELEEVIGSQNFLINHQEVRLQYHEQSAEVRVERSGN